LNKFFLNRLSRLL